MDTNPDDAHPFADEDVIAFGSFRLNRTTRTLLQNGHALSVGSRAMEILLALTERAGAILSNRELLRRVWPNIVVEDGTVRVHVALLRKVLRDAEPGSDYVHNVTGRGYRFVASVSRQRGPAATLIRSPRRTMLTSPLRQPSRRNNLPRLLTPVFGREQATRALVARMTRERFVTLTGPGGSGKTTVAIQAADALAANHEHGVCFVDLAAARAPEAVWSALAASLGVAPVPPHPMPGIVARLSKQPMTKPMTMVLDNCEHMIETTTTLAQEMLRLCPRLNILATSREPLRASGEFAQELAPLAWPAASVGSSRNDLMEFPAMRLFVERAGAHDETGLDDDALPLVANVCRRLAGNPLAIEIAAGQVRWLGMKSLSGGLNDTLYLSIEGRRTAERRHQTLRASFEWSYRLLSHDEQVVFRRLSVLPGSFDADLAAMTIADERLTPEIVRECLVTLAGKSLIAADITQKQARYRLQDLPRAFAREKLHQVRRSPCTT